MGIFIFLSVVLITIFYHWFCLGLKHSFKFRATFLRKMSDKFVLFWTSRDFTVSKLWSCLICHVSLFEVKVRKSLNNVDFQPYVWYLCLSLPLCYRFLLIINTIKRIIKGDTFRNIIARF